MIKKIIIIFFKLNWKYLNNSFLFIKINITKPNNKIIRLFFSDIAKKKCKKVIIKAYKNKPTIPDKLKEKFLKLNFLNINDP